MRRTPVSRLADARLRLPFTDKSGLVMLFSDLLNTAYIKMLYSSTFHTANILVDAADVKRAKRLLSRRSLVQGGVQRTDLVGAGGDGGGGGVDVHTGRGDANMEVNSHGEGDNGPGMEAVWDRRFDCRHWAKCATFRLSDLILSSVNCAPWVTILHVFNEKSVRILSIPLSILVCSALV